MSTTDPGGFAVASVSASVSAWLADGVRHQILMRVLPVQRHDVLGPLSVARMVLATLQRRVEAAAAAADGPAPGTQGAGAAPGLQATGGPTADRRDLLAKLAEVKAQVAATVGAVAALRWWDAQHHQAPQPLSEAMAMGVGLVQLAMSLRGQRLQLQLDRAATAPPVLVHAPAALYAILGLLLHASEAQAQATLWRLRLADDGLWLHGERAPDAQGEPEAPAAPEAPEAPDAPGPEDGAADSTTPATNLNPGGCRHERSAPPMDPGNGLRPIDRPALEGLLSDLGWRLSSGPPSWCLHWPQNRPD